MLIFSLALEIFGWSYSEYFKTAKKCGFCEEFLSENHFEDILANFYCYDYGANASEAVRKITTHEKK